MQGTNGAGIERELNAGPAKTKKAKTRKVRIDDFTRAAAENEGRRSARIAFECRAPKLWGNQHRGKQSSDRRHLLSEQQLASYIASGFEAGVQYWISRMGAGTTDARVAGEAVMPIPLTVHSFPVKDVQPSVDVAPHTNGPGLRAALYVRVPDRLIVSDPCWPKIQPGDDGFHVFCAYQLDEQLHELRNHAAQRGWSIAAEFVQQHESGRYPRREKFHKMFDAAEKYEFDVLVFCSLDGSNDKGFQSTIAHVPVKELLDAGWRSNRLLRELPQLYQAIFR